MLPDDRPRLLADIGSHFARFVLETAPGHFEHMLSLRCAEHADFHAAISAYLATLPPGRIRHAAVAIGNPVEGDEVRMTNYHWQFSIEQMRERLAFDTLVVVNDFTALAMALPRLAAGDRRQVGGGLARENSVVGLLGAGSGLGVSALIPLAGGGHVALGTEGGHTSFAPRDERELIILRHAWKQYPHVSFERLLSGPGIELIHRALAEHAGQAGRRLAAPEITRLGLAGSDELCVQTLAAFCAMLGTAAGNLAVTLGALGGIYIGGSIVPRLGSTFERSDFRRRFEDKGRFSDYLAGIPTWVVTADHATFLGISAILEAQLRTLAETGGANIFGQVRRARDQLSPAERRVADHVLAHPRAALSEPVAEIARAAQVSQPTVIRFCRSLGCEGLSDFKLRLASALTASVPVTHTQVTLADSTLELGAKVLGNTASAVLQLRDHLSREAIERATALLLAARRVDVFAIGAYAVVADDAHRKFLRLGKAGGVYTEPRLQAMAADVLGAGDVAVVISSSGRKEELLAVADTARARGAAVVALTASQSPLARKADVAVLIDHGENIDTQLPMVSRILHLLLVDILSVGMALQPGSAAPEPATTGDEADPAGARPSAPGISTATTLSHLTSHSR